MVAADLVVDAMGRRTPSGGWLAAAGAREPAIEARDRGFVYYTRYFTGPNRPQRRGPALQPMGSFSLLTLDSDNDTWSVTLFGLTGDAPLKNLRDPDTFTRVVSACPIFAHWLEGLQHMGPDAHPLGDVVQRLERRGLRDPQVGGRTSGAPF